MRLSLKCLIAALSVTGLIPASAVAQPVISIEGDCPGRLVVSWEGASVGRWAVLVFSRDTGRVLLPAGPCQGTWIDLDLHQARFAKAWRIESEQGQLVGNATAFACGGFLQLVINDGAPCTTSNVVQVPQ